MGLDGRPASEGAASPVVDDARSRPRRKRAEPVALGIGIIASISVVGALYLGRDFIVPLLIGILISYALGPIVDWLEARRIPRSVGAAVVMSLLFVGFAWALYSLQDVASSMSEKLPEAAHKVRQYVRATFDGGPSAIQNIQAAAAELQVAATEAAGATTPAAPTPAKPAAKPAEATSGTAATWLRDYMLAQSALLLTVLEHAPVVMLLAFFLLASGEHFRKKLMKVVGPSRERKKDAIKMLEEIDVQVQRYLLVTLISNVLVGLATGIAFAALGMEQPVAWGMAAGILHFIPYLGEIVFAVIAGAAAFIQLGTALDVMLVAGAALVISWIVGLFITTWLHSRFARVNATVIFVALLFFGWLWGIWGLLLGAPIVAIAKVICDRVEWLKPAGEFMGH